MAEEQDANKNGEEESPVPKKSSKLKSFAVLIIGILALGGGGYYAFQTFMMPQKTAMAPAQSQKEEVTDFVGEVVMLEPFVVNLADPKGKRYLKVQIGLEVEDSMVAEKVEKVKPKLRDMVIILLTSLTFEEVMTPEGKVQIRDELLERFNQIMRPDRVRNVYFTEFVVQ